MRGRPKDTKMAPASKRPEVVEVCAVRGFQRYVARTPKHKTMRSVVTHSTPLAATHARGSSSTGLSSRDSTIQLGASAQAASKQGRPSSPAMVGHGTQYSQAVGGSSFHASPSHFVTTYHATHNSDSDSIHGSCNKLLDKICFPCGHYYEDS
ncbi:hypothetical protein EDB19DRAFT_1725160 [Suillus lakei]|nr:hypothetical protein EDB19DRAFT_1725160 [Suillus lakei]